MKFTLFYITVLVSILLEIHAKIYRFHFLNGGLFTNGLFNRKCDGTVVGTTVTSSQSHCIHKCLVKAQCGTINTKILGVDRVQCELIKDSGSKEEPTLEVALGWQCFQTAFDYLALRQKSLDCRTKNPPNCSPEEKLNPAIYIPFDDIQYSVTFYTIGHDAKMNMYVVATTERVEKDPVLLKNVFVRKKKKKMPVGNFDGHPLDDPDGKDVTISLWIKCFPRHSVGRYTSYMFTAKQQGSGFFLGHTDYGEMLFFLVGSKRRQWRMYNKFQLTGRCFKWTHLAITYSAKESRAKAYINGTVTLDLKQRPAVNISRDSVECNIGEVERFTKFAYWERLLTDEEIKSLQSN